MAFLFSSKKQKSPSELVKHTKEAISSLEKGGKAQEKASEEIAKCLSSMRFMLYGDQDNEPNQEACSLLANEIKTYNLLPALVNKMPKFPFEAKKDVAAIFNNLLRKQVGGRLTTVEYIQKNPDLLMTLIEGYKSHDIALNCGLMLRECIRHEQLANVVLHAPEFYNFFDYVEVANFDVQSDAFATFKDLLTEHKSIAANFLESNYDKVFECYTTLLKSENYVTRRQSLKLLGELLLDRTNFNVMTRYISDQNNLKRMMQLLRDKSRSIQFEAFHVFKVFVANPNKAKAILDILIKNKQKLITFLSDFHNENEEEQFNDEKAFLLKQIQQLPDAV